MKWVVTSEEMRNIDTRAITKIGIPGTTLMERAGLQVIDTVLDITGAVTNKNIYIFCGKGNNGGDGLVIARELKRLGANLRIFVIGKRTDLKGDPALNYNILRKMGLKIEHINSQSSLNQIDTGADIVIDALLGTGIKGEVKGLLGEAIKKINSLQAFVVSVDLPSGLNADNGLYVNECINADLTVTMGLLKRGLLLHPGKTKAGVVEVADIGFPEKAVSPEKVNTFLIDDTDIQLFLPRRLPFYYKGDCGRILIIGGAPGMTGAPCLTAEAALRSGAGMTLLGIPEGLNSIIESKLTETMTLPLPENEDGMLSLKAEDKILDTMAWADVLAIGPGIGRSDDTINLILSLLKKVDTPIVLDADALYALSKNTSILRSRVFETVITPHLGEFCRLIQNIDVPEVEVDRIEVIRKYAKNFRSTIVLKGAPTLTAADSGEVYINSTGNAGMATAGSGDVLTGIIAGLIGQGLESVTAGLTGSYLHGAAGDLASEELGQHGVIAGDLIDFLPYAFDEVSLEDDE